PFVTTGVQSQLMSENKVWLRQPDGSPRIVADEFAYQLEHASLAGFLERVARRRGIAIVLDTPGEVLLSESGVSGLRLKSGQTLGADVYVDASGSQSILLGQALAEPFRSYLDTLWCDRAVAGAWQRAEEPIKPYTTAQAMNAGWCWQSEHEHHISCGYVYSSSYLTDQEAEAEFRATNPKVQATR